MAHAIIYLAEFFTHTLCVFILYETAGAVAAVVFQLLLDLCGIFLIGSYCDTHTFLLLTDFDCILVVGRKFYAKNLVHTTGSVGHISTKLNNDVFKF